MYYRSTVCCKMSYWIVHRDFGIKLLLFIVLRQCHKLWKSSWRTRSILTDPILPCLSRTIQFWFIVSQCFAVSRWFMKVITSLTTYSIVINGVYLVCGTFRLLSQTKIFNTLLVVCVTLIDMNCLLPRTKRYCSFTDKFHYCLGVTNAICFQRSLNCLKLMYDAI